MTDVLSEWKNRRFIIPDNIITDGTRCVILTDIAFWAKNVDQLVEWCETRNCETMGMVVEFGDEATLLEFVLKWS